MAGLRRRGLAVQPFKCGPDFLDSGHHTRICGRTARNLDTWMLSIEANRSVLRNAARGADVVVAEGMMGRAGTRKLGAVRKSPNGCGSRWCLSSMHPRVREA